MDSKIKPLTNPNVALFDAIIVNVEVVQQVSCSLFVGPNDNWTMFSSVIQCLSCSHCRCPWLSERFSVAVPIYNGVIFLFVLANFCMATFMDPGIFPRGDCMICCPYCLCFTTTPQNQHQLNWFDLQLTD